MDKRQMLHKIAQQEYDWLNSLDKRTFVNEYNGWFGLDEENALTEDDDTLKERRPILTSDYVEDFMRYRENESEEELLQLIK